MYTGMCSDPKTDLLAPLLAELKRLEAYLGQGASVRIWYSDAPYSLCGLYHLCSILLKWGNAVYTVKMPEYLSAPRFITRYQNLGEVPPDVFSTFLTAEKRLSRLEIQMYAMHWENLKKDNSPLRAVVNGRVIGVPESFYDFLIWKHLTKRPVRQVLLICELVGQYQLSVGDWWYARRIDLLITQGKILISEDSADKMQRMLYAGPTLRFEE